MTNRSIYELTGEWLSVYDLANDPEMDEESWFGMMEAISDDIEHKAENTAKIITMLKGEAEPIKAEAERLSKRAKALENRAEALKRNLEKSMIATGKTKFKTELFSFGIQKNPATVELNEGFSIDDVPAEFLKFEAPKLMKKELLQAINNGEEFEFCHKAQSESLRIR